MVRHHPECSHEDVMELFAVAPESVDITDDSPYESLEFLAACLLTD